MSSKSRKTGSVESSKFTAFQAHLFISIPSPVPSRREYRHSSSNSEMAHFTELLIAQTLRKRSFSHKTQALILYYLHQKSVVTIGIFTNDHEILALQPFIPGIIPSEMLLPLLLVIIASFNTYPLLFILLHKKEECFQSDISKFIVTTALMVVSGMANIYTGTVTT